RPDLPAAAAGSRLQPRPGQGRLPRARGRHLRRKEGRLAMAQIDALFDALLARKGSDLHLGVGYPPLMRVRGELETLRDSPVDANEMEDLLYEIIGPGEKEKIRNE